MTTGIAMLRSVAAALGQASTVDHIARSTLTSVLGIPGVARAGLALSRGGGRQLQFVGSDGLAAASGSSLPWCLIDAFDPVPLNDAVRTGEDVYLSTAADIARRYPALAGSERWAGMQALVALTLTAGTELLGGLLLAYDREQPFDPRSRWLLGSLAAQVAQALRRERVQEQRWGTAEALQRSLMPDHLPEPAGLLVSARYEPGELGGDVGGDWYDVVDLDDGSTLLVLGDVMGKGVEAALVMGEVRTALRAYALHDPRPGALLAMLDRFVLSRGSDHLVTVACGRVQPDRGEVRVAIAGHPPPLLVPATGEAQVLEAALGPALGLGATSWPEARVTWAPGDSLLMFSDGMVHGRGSDILAGMQRLRDAVSSLPRRRRRPRDLCAATRRVMREIGSADDRTLLAVGRAPGQLRRASCSLPHDPRAAGMARHFLRGALARWQVEEDVVETALLCASELVTNAIVHGGTTTELVVEDDGEALTVLVTDRGGRSSVRLSDSQDPTEVSGRGLSLVDALAWAWDSERTPEGTAVWFELPVGVDVGVRADS